MSQMLQLHSSTSRCGEWRTWKVTLPQWQLPLCSTSSVLVLMILMRLVKPYWEKKNEYIIVSYGIPFQLT